MSIYARLSVTAQISKSTQTGTPSRPLHFIFLAKFVMNFKDKVGIIDKSTVESIGSPFKNISVIQQWIVLFAKYNHLYEIFLYLTHTI